MTHNGVHHLAIATRPLEIYEALISIPDDVVLEGLSDNTPPVIVEG